MSDLTNIEKRKFEKLFEMNSGYVCNFSDRTLSDFILDSVGLEIHSEKYFKNGTSKANKLRTFWSIESNYTTSKLLGDLLEYWKVEKTNIPVGILAREASQVYDQVLHDVCFKAVERLKNNNALNDADFLKQFDGDENYALLIDSMRLSLSKDQPDQAIDRLHTLVIKYIRQLCKKHNILFDTETSLHTLFGNYVKFLQEQKLVESEMALRILKSSISLLDAFNNVRNSQSLAHDNKVLNRNESILIFNNISSFVKFIDEIEKIKIPSVTEKNKNDIRVEDIPF